MVIDRKYKLFNAEDFDQANFDELYEEVRWNIYNTKFIAKVKIVTEGDPDLLTEEEVSEVILEEEWIRTFE